MTTEERFEKIEAGIRDLIVVSRTTLHAVEQLTESVGGLQGSIGELREAQTRTDTTLNALIRAQTETEHKVSRLADMVDKLVRFRGPNGQSGQPS